MGVARKCSSKNKTAACASGAHVGALVFALLLAGAGLLWGGRGQLIASRGHDLYYWQSEAPSVLGALGYRGGKVSRFSCIYLCISR